MNLSNDRSEQTQLSAASAYYTILLLNGNVTSGKIKIIRCWMNVCVCVCEFMGSGCEEQTRTMDMRLELGYIEARLLWMFFLVNRLRSIFNSFNGRFMGIGKIQSFQYKDSRIF